MRFLTAHHRVGAVGTENWARSHDPVVPNTPIGDGNTFLGVWDFKPVPYAEVSDTGTSLDAMALNLKTQFPGLPPPLWDTYVLAIAKLALKLPLGTICQIFIDEDTTKVKVADKDEFYTLWTKQPIPAGYA